MHWSSPRAHAATGCRGCRPPFRRRGKLSRPPSNRHLHVQASCGPIAESQAGQSSGPAVAPQTHPPQSKTQRVQLIYGQGRIPEPCLAFLFYVLPLPCTLPRSGGCDRRPSRPVRPGAPSAWDGADHPSRGASRFCTLHLRTRRLRGHARVRGHVVRHWFASLRSRTRSGPRHGTRLGPVPRSVTSLTGQWVSRYGSQRDHRGYNRND